MKAKKDGGFFERIQGKIHPVAVDNYYGPKLLKSCDSLPYLVKVLKAHVVMLAERDIIPKKAAGQLLTALSEIGSHQLELDPTLEDLYINLENYLVKQVGPETSGFMPVARSRNDVESTMWRIELREKLLRLAQSVLAVITTINDRAEETKESLMPGYTYGQQAQPVTMGHYLSGISAMLLRDVERIFDCINRFNYCPLGAAALAGTSYPIDRGFTASLLGFAGVLEHTQDAVAAADYMLEASGAAVICINTLTRFAEDIIRWCSNEVAFASLPDSLIDSSSIMPQKRNPVIVATVRSYGRLIAGKFAGICAASSVGFEASRDVTVAFDDVLESVNLTYNMSQIMQVCIKELIFDLEAMEQALKIGFSNTTEIADTLVKEGKIPFRTAHQVVGGAVAELHYQRKGPEDFTFDLLNDWCRKITGSPLPVDKERIELAFDFKVGVDRRNCIGGPAAAEVERMIEKQRNKARNLQETARQLLNKWETADIELRERAGRLIG